MKAMVLKGPNLPFQLEQRPDPAAGPGEAVARVITCGAGLTIQHAKAGRRKVQFPRIIGHEITGEIVEVGAGVRGLKVGDAGDHLFLSQLRPLPLVPDQSGAAVREQRRPDRARMRRRLRRIRQTAGAELHQAAGRPRQQKTSRRDRRGHRCAGDALQGAPPRPREGRRDRCGDRRRRWARHPSIDDGEMGEGARHRGRHQAGKIRRLPESGRRRGGRCQRRSRRRAIDGSDRRARASTSWSITSLRRRRSKPAPRRWRGAGVSSRSAAQASRSRRRRPTCSTRSRICSAAATSPAARFWNRSIWWRAARCFRWCQVVRPLEEAEAVHELVERGEVIGRAALRIA